MKWTIEEIMEEWCRLSREIDDSTKTGCLSSIQIIGYTDNSLNEGERKRVEEHLAHCNYCVLEVTEALQTKAQYESLSVTKWQKLPADELREVIRKAIDDFRSTVSKIFFPASTATVAADGVGELTVSVADENGGEKSVAFTVESGPAVDEEGQLSLALLAPDDSYDGQEIELSLKIGSGERLILGLTSVFGREVFIILDMDLEPGLEIPLEMFTATFRKRD